MYHNSVTAKLFSWHYSVTLLTHIFAGMSYGLRESLWLDKNIPFVFLLKHLQLVIHYCGVTFFIQDVSF